MANPHPKDAKANLKNFEPGTDERRQLKGRKHRYEIAKLIEERGAMPVEGDELGRTKAEAAIDTAWDAAVKGGKDGLKALEDLSKYGWGTPEVKDMRQVMLIIAAGAQQIGIAPRDDPLLGAIFAAAGYRAPAISAPRPTRGDSPGEDQAVSADQADIVDA